MKVALLTSGGIAPCLSASIGRLAERYYSKYPDVEIIGYLNGYNGLLLGKSSSINKNFKTYKLQRIKCNYPSQAGGIKSL